MNKTERLSFLEAFLDHLEMQPWGAIYRVAIGFAIPPLKVQLLGVDQTGLRLGLFFLGVLMTLRVVPLVGRRLLPFSETLHGHWAQRRMLAKRYDSYQWQKLFWLGLGILLYTALPNHWTPPRVVFSVVCLLAGALGLLKWRANVSHIHSWS